MKILYALQGTGNGHISRARDLVPILAKKGDLDVLISGKHVEVQLNYPVKYRYHGLGFIFGKGGGVDIMKTIANVNYPRFRKEMQDVPIEDYDIIINDFEPVTAWACKMKSIKCIGLGHQYAVLSSKAPKPAKFDPLGKLILKYYSPVSESYGFHFEPYDQKTFNPVIRSEIRNKIPSDKGHITVYLPAYSDERLIKFFTHFPEYQWQVFSKHTTKNYVHQNVAINLINNEDFIDSMLSSHGVFTGAGFETPAEALFLNKKLMVIPMSNQYEQHCNAAALKQMGVPVIHSVHKKYVSTVKTWLESQHKIRVNYQDHTEELINSLLEKHGTKNTYTTSFSGKIKNLMLSA